MTEWRTFRGSIARVVRTKLADSVDLLAVGVLVLAVLLAALRPSFFLVGTVLAASLVAAAACYLLASRALRRCKDVGVERMFIAAAAMVAGIWLFETVAWAGWSSSWGQVWHSLGHFNVNIPHAGGIFPLLWAAIMVGVMFVGAAHMRINRMFLLVLAAAVSLFALWMATGYPSHHQPWRSPDQAEFIQLIPTGYEHPRNPTEPGWAFITLWGSVFTSAAKILWGALPGLLYAHHLMGKSPSYVHQADDLLAKARRALESRIWGGRRGSRPPAEAPPLGAKEAVRPRARSRVGQAAATSSKALARRAARKRAYAAHIGPRIADLADIAMVGIIVAAIALGISRSSFVAVPPQLLSASLIGYALAYLLTSRCLRSRKELGVRRLFISLCALASSVWLFESIWWFWGFDVWYRAPSALFTLSLDTTAQPFPLTWALSVVGLVFTGARYMGPNRWIVVVFVAAVVTFEIWKAAGWPLFPRPQTWPEDPVRLFVIPREYYHPDTAEERAVVVFWGGLLNSITKIFWCALPGTLFLTRENLGAPIRRILWPPGPALKSLFMPWTQWSAPSGRSEDSAAAMAAVGWHPAAGQRRPAPVPPPSEPPPGRAATPHGRGDRSAKVSR